MNGSKKYPVAEKFAAPQGEGLYTGTPMKFIRFVGCSVGKGVCTACDTDFDKQYEERGGGMFTAAELLEWAQGYEHVCFTGGEPLDRNLVELIETFEVNNIFSHIETSGTKRPLWLTKEMLRKVWLTVSPKPGWLPEMIELADEVKVIYSGLGDGPGWPTLVNALEWAKDTIVYLQPRNDTFDIDRSQMDQVTSLVVANPTLRLSTQLHKVLGTR